MSNETTRRAAAWLVLDRNGFMWDFFTDDDAALKCAMQLDGTHVPLYRDPPPPALTDAEREALRAIRRTVMYQPHADAIDALLARLGGGE